MNNTKNIIMEAATQVFHEKGFNGARMQEIADLAKVNKAALHYYFSTKKDLFKQVFQTSFADLFSSFNTLLNDDLPILDKLDLLIESYFDFALDNIKNIKFILSSIDNNINIIKENISRHNAGMNFFDKIFNELEIEMEAGTIKYYNPRHLLVNVISMCIFPFIGQPIIIEVNHFSENEISKFIAERKPMIKLFVKSALTI